MTKTVAIMLGKGFEPLEVIAPVDILRRGGAQVTLVSVMNNREVLSAQDVMMNADVLIDDTNLLDFDALVIPGGSEGVENLKKSALLSDALKTFMAEDRPTAAICAGPTVLAALGLLNGRTATCYPGCEVEFPAGAYTDQTVVVDQNLITSQGPGTATDFGLALLESLMGKEIAQSVAKAMLIERA